MGRFEGSEKPITIYSRNSSWIKNLIITFRAIKQYKKIQSYKYMNDIFKSAYFFSGASLVSLYGKGRWSIGNQSLIGASLVCESREAEIVIGERTFIAPNSQVISSKKVTIGNNVLIAADVVIQDHSSHSLDANVRHNDIDYTLARFFGKPSSDKDWSLIDSEEIIIENNSWIGMRAIILKGVIIGARSIVGAGSVVTKSVPPDVVVAGNPAIIVKRLK